LSELTQSLYRDDRLAQWLTETVARLPVRHFTDQRLDRLSEETTSLAAAVGQLAESHRRAEAKLGTLTERVDRLTDVVGRLRGDVFELKYRDKVEVYFGPLARRVEGVRKRELEDALEAKLTHEELLEVLRLDLLVGGQPRRREPRRDALVAAEVSAVIDRNDVDRARRRTELLRKAGFDAIPAVAGEDLTRGAEELAAQQHVAVILEGSTSGWEEALQSWLPMS